MIAPVDAHISYSYDQHRRKRQRVETGYPLGVDFATPIGTECKAVMPGVVVVAGWDDPHHVDQGYGLHCIVEHEGGWRTYYAHLSRLVVGPGCPVQVGDLLGYTGNTGGSSGPHLHFELRQQTKFGWSFRRPKFDV